MDAAAHSTHSTNDPHTLISGAGSSHLSTGFDHPDNGNVKVVPYSIQSKRTGCIAGNHDGLHLLFLKKAADLVRIPDDRLPGFIPIGHPRCIAKIYYFL